VHSEHGKPSLANAAADIRFSVSHSGGLALLAVARGREVGVDLEAIREDVETDKLAERFFSEQEWQSLRLLPPEQRVPAFFRCWTCKEAFVKAQGVGLSRSLGSFDVDVNPEGGGRLVATRPDPGEAGRWSLHEIEAEPGYVAAVAVEGSIAALSIFRCK
jgi:4'-phosphopantetheinyl transferase